MTRFLLLVNHDGGAVDRPMLEWDPEDIRAHLQYLRDQLDELADSGELVEAQALAAPELAKVVRADGVSALVTTNGPYREAKEVLAGYQVIDVESEARAVEIAAVLSSAPGPGGFPCGQPIEVRQVMGKAGEL